MKKLCIVPFTVREYPLIQYLELSYDIDSLVTPKGIGIDGENISVLKRTTQVPYSFSNSVLSGISAADTVFISDVSPSQSNLYQLAKHALEISLDYKKEILCFLELSDTEIKEYKRKYPHWNSLVHFTDNRIEYEDRTLYNESFDLKVPILYIGETVPNCDSYDLFLKLIQRFKEDKKEVLALSENRYTSLLGQDPFYFWKKDLSPADMVCRVNSAIHKLITHENPDVVLVHLPEPMIKYDDEYHFDFGLTAYMVSQALPGDGCIICSPSRTPVQQFWDNINSNFSSKFGYEILGICVNNVRIDSTKMNSLSLYRFSVKEIEQELDLLNTYNNLNFFSLYDHASFESFFAKLSEFLFSTDYGVI